MKRKSVMSAILILITTVLCVSACAENAVSREIILLTEYQQMGWGENFQLAFVDSNGNLWIYESSTRGDVPFDAEELLAWAETAEGPVLTGRLAKAELTDIRSLAETVSAQEISYQHYACDAGEQVSYAVRKDRNGTPVMINLGVSGDSTYENTDPAAQSLYRSLRKFFPSVTSFDGGPGMAPAGFQPVNLAAFCGYADIDLTKPDMTVWANDCEVGLTKIEPLMTPEEILNLNVMGKQNSLSVTGNTVIYCFEDENGDTVAAFEFYDGLLIRPDGMYVVESKP